MNPPSAWPNAMRGIELGNDSDCEGPTQIKPTKEKKVAN